MSRGLFITLEGPDGSGKSTQIAAIEEYFLSKGKKVLLSREPGGTKISEKLREIVLDSRNGEMADMTEMLIYAASRAQHVAELLRPAVDRGEIVICDRFMDSSIAYQGYGRGLGDKVCEVNLYAVDGLVPDITFLLDIDPKTGKERINAGRQAVDRLELQDMTFHYEVYDGYKAIAAANPDRVVIIDAAREPAVVSADILSHLDKYCKDHGII